MLSKGKRKKMIEDVIKLLCTQPRHVKFLLKLKFFKNTLKFVLSQLN